MQNSSQFSIEEVKKNLEWYFESEPFSIPAKEYEIRQLKTFEMLTAFHRANSQNYSKVLKALGEESYGYVSANQVPYLPVSIFKDFEMRSIQEGEVLKTMTSSGTSGQLPSRIYLDSYNALNQTKALTKIVGSILGKRRLPMIIVDVPSTINDRKKFSARAAGILGFSMFGTDKIFALNEDYSLNHEVIEKFLNKHNGEKILVFGFTFIVWKYFIKPVHNQRLKFNLNNGTLVHGGGWKKLENESVSSIDFNEAALRSLGLHNIHDYYGMVEQTGSIFVECSQHFLHSTHFSDICTRSPIDLSQSEFGVEGVIQTMSVLPTSYPGHSLLTEDLGTIFGKDDCACGWPGKYFKVSGRLKMAEVRGCSDTFSV